MTDRVLGSILTQTQGRKEKEEEKDNHCGKSPTRQASG